MTSSNKRKRIQVSARDQDQLDTSKPTAIFRPSGKRRKCTVSLAVPGSIVSNAVTQDGKTQLAGQIARALAVFCIDEIVIFEDGTKPAQTSRNNGRSNGRRQSQDEVHHRFTSIEDQYTGNSDPSQFLEHILTYLETPPFLRRRLFPHHLNLASSGLLPSLDMPHHLRADDSSPYREGIVLDGATTYQRESSISLVDVGYERPMIVQNVELEPGTRVTVKAEKGDLSPASRDVRALVCHPREPRDSIGLYWGYSIRRADDLSAVFTGSPFVDGYDLSIGTSERGIPLQTFLSRQTTDPDSRGAPARDLAYEHVIVFFGGVAGLEPAVRNDRALSGLGDPQEVFDHWVNILPDQGSRTIRTEEALWIALSQMSGWIQAQG